jgi:hypothetical protein
MIVDFTAAEFDAICKAAKAVTARSAHIPNPKRFNRNKASQADLDCCGLACEFAVAKSLGLELDACAVLLKGKRKDQGNDIANPWGAVIQVKGTQPKRNYSHVWPWTSQNPGGETWARESVIVQVVLGELQAKIIGWTTPAQWAKHAQFIGYRGATNEQDRKWRMAWEHFWPWERVVMAMKGKPPVKFERNVMAEPVPPEDRLDPEEARAWAKKMAMN